MKRFIREWLFQKWYWYISKTDKNAEVLFMNFGYDHPTMTTPLLPGDEINRYSIQLYHQLAMHGQLSGKSVCEVGCGRGGGLSYLHRSFKPSRSLGIDLNPLAIDFNTNFYKEKDMLFMQGDAQALPVEDESFDVVINVESSHRYPKFRQFLSEVHRSLKPGGQLLITDFRSSEEIDAMKADIEVSGFKVIHTETINQQVVDALTADDARRRELVKRLIPSLLKSTGLNFAGAMGTETYNRFKENKYVYFNYVLQK